jgi:hypothetical protein
MQLLTPTHIWTTANRGWYSTHVRSWRDASNLSAARRRQQTIAEGTHGREHSVTMAGHQRHWNEMPSHVVVDGIGQE